MERDGALSPTLTWEAIGNWLLPEVGESMFLKHMASVLYWKALHHRVYGQNWPYSIPQLPVTGSWHQLLRHSLSNRSEAPVGQHLFSLLDSMSIAPDNGSHIQCSLEDFSKTMEPVLVGEKTTLDSGLCIAWRWVSVFPDTHNLSRRASRCWASVSALKWLSIKK